MTQEDYVSFEVARLLEEKGFDGDTSSCYILEDGTHHIMSDEVAQNEWYDSQDSNEHGHLIQAPTHQMARRWLREVHNININIIPIWNQKRWEYQVFVVTPKNAKQCYVDDKIYLGYEEAVEAALKYCLENLLTFKIKEET